MVEVHIIGHIDQIKSDQRRNLYCKWFLHLGNDWSVISGKIEGQALASIGAINNRSQISSPVDIHLSTASLRNWPQIYVQVYDFDWFGRSQASSYGFLNVPSSPGLHKIDCYTWRPYKSLRRRFVDFFLGGIHEVKSPDLIFDPVGRSKILTEAVGKVTVELNVVLRNLKNYSVEY